MAKKSTTSTKKKPATKKAAPVKECKELCPKRGHKLLMLGLQLAKKFMHGWEYKLIEEAICKIFPPEKSGK